MNVEADSPAFGTPGPGTPASESTGNTPLRDELSTENDRLWATLMHLTVLIPVFSFVPLLCIWLQKRNESAYIDDHGKEALSFQISMFIWQVAAGVMSIFLIGLPFVILLPILALIMGIVNGIKANQGYYVRYPITIRFFQ